MRDPAFAFFISTVACLMAQAQTIGMHMQTPEDSPVSIVRMMTTTDFAFRSVTIQNRTDKRVTAVTLGFDLRGKPIGKAGNITSLSAVETFPVRLSPRREQRVDTYLGPLGNLADRLKASEIADAVAVIRPLAVQFSDHTEWALSQPSKLFGAKREP